VLKNGSVIRIIRELKLNGFTLRGDFVDGSHRSVVRVKIMGGCDDVADGDDNGYEEGLRSQKK